MHNTSAGAFRTGQCGQCHSLNSWLGAKGYPANYLINDFIANGTTRGSVLGYTGAHTTTNTNCTQCHAADATYKTITAFDHQGLPANSITCNSCHIPNGAVAVNGKGVTMANLNDRHHRAQYFFNSTTGVATGLTCVGCHTESRGANTFTSQGGVIIPASAKQAYINVGCGSVNASTFSCHEDGQKPMVIPRTPSTNGNF